MIDRNRKIELTIDELEEIIEKSAKIGAEEAITGLQAKIFIWAGKGIIDKAIYIVGAIAVSIFFFLDGKGLLKM